MKYRVSQYAEAFYLALEGKSEVEQKKIIKHFVELLVCHRATGRIRAICETYEKLSLVKKGMRSVRMETATPASEKLKTEIRTVLGKNIYIEEIVNPDLLGGVKILVDDDILIDASTRRQVEDLFIKKPPSVR